MTRPGSWLTVLKKSMSNDSLYHYKATILRVIDGDTVEARVDLGFKIHFTQKFRLLNIDAPEIRGEKKNEGRAAASHLIKLICSHAANLEDGKLPDGALAVIQIETLKDKTGKYGRYLCRLWGLDQDGSMVDINQKMVHDGHAQSSD